MSFCDNQNPTCDVCYEQTITDCDFTFTTGLEDATYFFTVIDKFGKGRTNQFDVVGGQLTLDKTDFPDGFFNSFSGYYEMFAHTTSSDYTRLNMTISDAEYKCINFNATSNCCT